MVAAAALGVAAPAASADELLVTNFSSDTVSVIDTATNAVVGSPITVGDEPVAIAITPDGSRAYVANRGSDTVSVIDVATRATVGDPIAFAAPDAQPMGVAVSPDGTKVYVSLELVEGLELAATKKNSRKGTATISVRIPAAGEVALGGKQLVSQHKEASGAGEVSLKVQPKAAAKRKLKCKGKLAVHPTITFTPAGGSPESQSLDVKLKRKGAGR